MNTPGSILRAHGILLCLMLVTASYVLSGPCLAEQNTKQKAKKHFKNGVSLFKESDYEGAYVEFVAAYETSPHYRVRYNIGICLYKMHRYAAAQYQLNAYIAEGGKKVPKKKKKEVTEILDELKDLVGSLKVTCNVQGATLLVDDVKKATLPSPHPLRLDVGQYKVSIVSDGFEEYTHQIIIPGGDVVVLDVTLQPVVETGPEEDVVQERSKLSPAAFWSFFGLTLAFAGSAAITGGLAMSKSREYESMNYEDDWRPVMESGRHLMIATNVLWGITGAMGITTLVLGFFTEFKPNRETSVTIIPSLHGPAILFSRRF